MLPGVCIELRKMGFSFPETPRVLFVTALNSIQHSLLASTNMIGIRCEAVKAVTLLDEGRDSCLGDYNVSTSFNLSAQRWIIRKRNTRFKKKLFPTFLGAKAPLELARVTKYVRMSVRMSVRTYVRTYVRTVLIYYVCECLNLAELYRTLWIFLELFGTLWNFMELYGTLWNFMELYGTFWNFLELYGTFWKFMEIYGTFLTLWIWNFLEL